ncbi:MAG: hypothetical protein ACTSPQ_20585 [Candidatus Helarchaeota archaeon]
MTSFYRKLKNISLKPIIQVSFLIFIILLSVFIVYSIILPKLLPSNIVSISNFTATDTNNNMKYDKIGVLIKNIGTSSILPKSIEFSNSTDKIIWNINSTLKINNNEETVLIVSTSNLSLEIPSNTNYDFTIIFSYSDSEKKQYTIPILVYFDELESVNLPMDNLLLWLKPDVFFALGDKSEIGLWIDSSPNNHNTIQLTNSYKPKLLLNNIDNNPSIFFNGVNNFLSLDDFSYNTSNLSFFIVFKPINTEFFGHLIGHYDWGTNERSWLIRLHERRINALFSKNGSFDEETGKNCFSSSLILSSQTVLSEIAWNRGNISMYINNIYQNVFETKFNSSFSSLHDSKAKISIGASLYNSLAKFFFHGSIAEILIYEKTLNESERQNITNYLMQKWDIIEPFFK